MIVLSNAWLPIVGSIGRQLRACAETCAAMIAKASGPKFIAALLEIWTSGGFHAQLASFFE